MRCPSCPSCQAPGAPASVSDDEDLAFVRGAFDQAQERFRESYARALAHSERVRRIKAQASEEFFKSFREGFALGPVAPGEDAVTGVS